MINILPHTVFIQHRFLLLHIHVISTMINRIQNRQMVDTGSLVASCSLENQLYRRENLPLTVLEK